MSKITLDTLMNKTLDQLYKEMERRGLHSVPYGKSNFVQAILEHDAYYDGVNDARRNCVKNGKPGVETKPKSESKPALYSLVDISEPCEKPFLLWLTPEQENFLYVLRDHNIIYEDIAISRIEREEIIVP